MDTVGAEYLSIKISNIFFFKTSMLQMILQKKQEVTILSTEVAIEVTIKREEESPIEEMIIMSRKELIINNILEEKNKVVEEDKEDKEIMRNSNI